MAEITVEIDSLASMAHDTLDEAMSEQYREALGEEVSSSIIEMYRGIEKQERQQAKAQQEAMEESGHPSEEDLEEARDQEVEEDNEESAE